MDVGAGLYMYDVVVKKFMFAISSPDEFLLRFLKIMKILTQSCFLYVAVLPLGSFINVKFKNRVILRIFILRYTNVLIIIIIIIIAKLSFSNRAVNE